MELFDLLISENEEIVLNAIQDLEFTNIDTKTNAYLLNIGYFHPSKKIKNLARKKLVEFQCEELILQIENNWAKDTLKEQKYIHKQLYENNLVDSSEYLTIAQATRRNYFLKNKKSRFLSLAYMRYDDDVENIFDCYQVQIENISENLVKLRHITVANFNNQMKLDFENVVSILSKLPNLKFLQIAKSDLKKLPNNIAELKSLKRLIIERNPIESLGDFKSEKLERLEIKGTNITVIDFDNFPNLKELWVDDQNSKSKMNFKNTRGNVKLTSGLFYSEYI